MLPGSTAEREQANSRSFLFGLVMLVVFLSLQSESWQLRRNGPDGRGALRNSPALHREVVKEKIILDLSVSNEKLEEENQRLKSDLYRVRSELTALRGNATDDDVENNLLSRAAKAAQTAPTQQPDVVATTVATSRPPVASASRALRVGSQVGAFSFAQPQEEHLSVPVEEEEEEALERRL